MVLCLMIRCVNRQEYDNLLQFNTSWLASPGTRYYFSFCFSFSSSDYDLSLIKKSHTLNCYSFLQKFLLKTKTYKLIVGNCSSSIYCSNNKFRKSSLLYSLAYCSIKKNVLTFLSLTMLILFWHHFLSLFQNFESKN